MADSCSLPKSLVFYIYCVAGDDLQLLSLTSQSLVSWMHLYVLLGIQPRGLYMLARQTPNWAGASPPTKQSFWPDHWLRICGGTHSGQHLLSWFFCFVFGVLVWGIKIKWLLKHLVLFWKWICGEGIFGICSHRHFQPRCKPCYLCKPASQQTHSECWLTLGTKHYKGGMGRCICLFIENTIPLSPW